MLRYPKEKENITHINYEPWHFRYVGIEHATKIHNSDITYEEYHANLQKIATDLSKAPTFTVKNGKVTFSSTKGTEIRYTTDLSTPKIASKPNKTELGGNNITYKAAAFKEGYSSPVTTVTITAYGDVFRDITIKDWFYSYVSDAVHQEVFNGMGNYEFAPNGTMTRAMLVQVLANISGIDPDRYSGKTSFSDVRPSKWYAPAIQWASENNIVQGMGNGQFAPEGPITREQACVIFYNHSGKASNGKLTFTDKASISSWSRDGVAFCVEKAVVCGYPDGSFRPKANATRA